MTLINTVSPDFPPSHIAGWFIFNTWLQNTLQERVRLELHDSFSQQQEAIQADGVDMIYANPADAALLVREKGFVGVARPANQADEAVIVVADTSAAQSVEDLESTIKVALTAQPDVNTMGMIMLEPADVSPDTVTKLERDTYVLVAKALMDGEADVGFFLKDAYENLSSIVKSKLRVLVTSDIQVVRHGLLLGPKMQQHRDALLEALLTMHTTDSGKEMLSGLGFDAWEEFHAEDVEFMIDLMETLTV